MHCGTQMLVEAVYDVDKVSKEKSALSRDGACDAVAKRLIMVLPPCCQELLRSLCSTGFLPHRAMPSCDRRLQLDTWNTSGLQEKSFW